MAALACLSIQAQIPVTVSTGASNAEQIWYSLLNGEVGARALAEWDLAFEMTGLTAGIRVNTAKGLQVYQTDHDISQWDDLTAPDVASWTFLSNDVTRWDMGALNHGNDMDEPEGLNVGWGVYNPINHQMIGNKVYAIEFPDDTWKKLRINSVISGVFSFTYANLDGSNSHDGSVNKSQFAGKNFAYWSFSDNASLDREPASADWDLLFTKYAEIMDDEGELVAYPVAGVLQNRLVPAMKVEGVPTDEAEWGPGSMQTAINVIGYDWKSYDFNEGMYVVQPNTTYFVKDRPGNVWKLIFTGYGGAGNGNMSFTKEMISAVGVEELGSASPTMLVYPNPAVGGQARLVLDLPESRATIRVFNRAGQQVLEEAMDGLHGMAVRELDVRRLAPGLYVLRVETRGGVATGKLVIE